MKLNSSGWFKSYLQFRLETPFDFWDQKELLRERATEDSFLPDLEYMDSLFYTTLRESGVLFGCPVFKREKAFLYRGLRFLNNQDQSTFVNIETLFTCLFRELIVFAQFLGSYEEYLARTTIRITQFYLGVDLDNRFFNMEASLLIKDREFTRLLSGFEKKFLSRIKSPLQLSFNNSLQNNYAFWDIYGLINWNRKFHNQPTSPIYFLAEIEQNHISIQKQLILTFAGLLWQSEVKEQLGHQLLLTQNSSWKNITITKVRQKLLSRYIKASRLSNEDKKNLDEVINDPVFLDNIDFEITDFITNKYIMEQIILMSLVESQGDPKKLPYIQSLQKKLQITETDMETSFYSVADFFFENELRFDFFRGNRSFYNLTNGIKTQITSVIKKNMDSIINEIKRTGTLYNLLARSGNSKLTEEEKRFVRVQLLSIAKTVPALAIFCLPAGGLVLTVLIKFLPFNILPNSFAD